MALKIETQTVHDLKTKPPNLLIGKRYWPDSTNSTNLQVEAFYFIKLLLG